MRRFLANLTLVSLLVGTIAMPAPAFAEGPPGGPSLGEVPPLRAEGPVTLPDGRVLPVKPAWIQGTSVQAEMLAAHANDRLHFVPGARPQPRGSSTARGMRSCRSDRWCRRSRNCDRRF